jgi:hypothetical protein
VGPSLWIYRLITKLIGSYNNIENNNPFLKSQVNFGDVFIPAGLDPPRPRVLPEFKRLAHGLRSGNISVLDAKTFYIPNLHYDGAGPDAYFWVGNGTEPNPFGTKVPKHRIFFFLPLSH